MNALKAKKVIPILKKFCRKYDLRLISIMYNELWTPGEGHLAEFIVVAKGCYRKLLLLTMCRRIELQDMIMNAVTDFTSVFFVHRKWEMKWKQIDEEGFETIYGKKLLERRIK